MNNLHGIGKPRIPKGLTIPKLLAYIGLSCRIHVKYYLKQIQTELCSPCLDKSLNKSNESERESRWTIYMV